MKLIELTKDGKKILFNMAAFSSMLANGDKTRVRFRNGADSILVNESYERVLSAIINAKPDAPVITVSKD